MYTRDGSAEAIVRDELRQLYVMPHTVYTTRDGSAKAIVLDELRQLYVMPHKMYTRDGSAEAIVRDATQRQELQFIQLCVSSSHSSLTPSQPVLCR